MQGIWMGKDKMNLKEMLMDQNKYDILNQSKNNWDDDKDEDFFEMIEENNISKKNKINYSKSKNKMNLKDLNKISEMNILLNIKLQNFINLFEKVLQLKLEQKERIEVNHKPL